MHAEQSCGCILGPQHYQTAVVLRSLVHQQFPIHPAQWPSRCTLAFEMEDFKTITAAAEATCFVTVLQQPVYWLGFACCFP